MVKRGVDRKVLAGRLRTLTERGFGPVLCAGPPRRGGEAKTGVGVKGKGWQRVCIRRKRTGVSEGEAFVRDMGEFIG